MTGDFMVPPFNEYTQQINGVANHLALYGVDRSSAQMDLHLTEFQ